MAPKKVTKKPVKKVVKKTNESEDEGPKRPLTAYHFWMKDNLAEIKTGGYKGKTLQKQCGKRWKALSEEERQPYVEQAEDAKDEYHRLLAEYNNAE